MEMFTENEKKKAKCSQKDVEKHADANCSSESLSAV